MTKTELEAALLSDPLDSSLIFQYSQQLLTGPYYETALKNIHETLKPQRYVEIGVCKGGSFKYAAAETRAIGIDPEPQLDINALPTNHKVIASTSDDYFDSGQLRQDLNGEPLDLALIDGMHLFEYALRDFIHLEQHSHADSVILVHDVFPITELSAERERETKFWSGDIWKLMICLQEQRPDLNCSVLPCPPTGLGVITGLNPNSTVLLDNLDAISERYRELPFSRVAENRAEKLRLTTAEHPWLG